MSTQQKTIEEMIEEAFDMCMADFQPFDLLQLDNLEINGAVERQYGETDDQLRERINPIKCECGKEKHGFASHSTWCKKWNQGN